MYKRKKIKINIFYKENGDDILDVLELDFKEFFELYLKEKVL